MTTKILERKQRKKVYENKLAIMIENPKNSDNSKTNKTGMGIGIGSGINVISSGGLGSGSGLGGGSGIGIGLGVGLGSNSLGSGGLGGGGIGVGLGGGGIGLGAGIKSGISNPGLSNMGMPKGAFNAPSTKAQEKAFGAVKIEQKVEELPPPIKIETPQPEPLKE